LKRKKAPWRLPHLEDDGLFTPEVGSWAEEKYRHLRNYAEIFTTSMKGKWDHRVYIDLFAGAGRSRIEENGIIVPASPILALELPRKFDKYLFCERDEEKISALEARVVRSDPNVNVTYVAHDVNTNVRELLSAIPGGKVLTFCFADPYRIADLRFDTLRVLSSRYVDFLVLLPSFMDVNRNAPTYLAQGNEALDGFLGSADWRQEWKKAETEGEKLGQFFVNRFGGEMKKMGYLYPDVTEAKLVRGPQNIPLYHLAFFSRHPLGAKFWKQAKEYGSDQRSLPSF
jgi:three-Cys-motif partner protein